MLDWLEPDELATLKLTDTYPPDNRHEAAHQRSRAHEFARELAVKRKSSMTEVVIDALEAALRRETAGRPLAELLAEIANDLQAKSNKGGRDVTDDEVDCMWGH